MKQVVLILGLLLSIMAFSQDRITGKNFATRSEVIAKNGMVCTSQPLATQIGLDVLKKGGTAIDAAIAANAALGSGRSPHSLTLDYFKENEINKIPALGPLPVSVPGCVDGWFELHQKFGKLPMTDILQPAIDYANDGFPVSELIAYYMGRSANYLSKYKNFEPVYMPNGAIPKKGEIFKNPYLANTLERIGKEGRDIFYKGEITTIVDFIQEQGGFLSMEDMQKHTSTWVEPVSTNYRGYDVWELPPNGQGIAALQILNVLELYDLKSTRFGSAEYIHAFVEAKKLAYEDRAKYYADMDFNKIPVAELISKEYARQILPCRKIKPRRNHLFNGC